MTDFKQIQVSVSAVGLPIISFARQLRGEGDHRQSPRPASATIAAGRSLALDRSEKGKRMRTTLPTAGETMLDLLAAGSSL
jgi:hypothetical protein